MKIPRRQISVLYLMRQTLLLICVIFGLAMFRNFLTGEKSYFLQFSNPADNVYQAVDEIERRGFTSTKNVNNVTDLYVVVKDPSSTLCLSICEMFEIVFIVKSFVRNVEQRNAIRSTWGTNYKIRIQTLFVVGYLEDIQSYIDIESNRYNDIIQFFMIDNYQNLVYKTIFALLWLVDTKISTKYVHFVDDDRLVNTMQLYRFAKNNIKTTDCKMIGHKLSFRRPFRDRLSKYYISTAEYPYDFWPPYLIGGTILTNMKVVRKLALTIPYVKIIHMEDSFIGIVSGLLNIELVHDSDFLAFFKPGIQLKNKLSSPDYKSKNLMIENWEIISKVND